jgi:glycosyltransferase involved in cell wall biosynthesis
MQDHPIAISAVVCTRNRGASIVNTINSILANNHPSFGLVVIDQSTNLDTEEAIAPFQAEPRLRYVHSRTQGLGRARNIGLSLIQSPIAAFTDDDCTVPPNWLEKIAIAFDTHPRISIVFCNVEAAEHDPDTSFISTYIRTDSKLLIPLSAKLHLRKPQSMRRLLYFLEGLWQGLRTPVDQEKCYSTPHQ